MRKHRWPVQESIVNVPPCCCVLSIWHGHQSCQTVYTASLTDGWNQTDRESFKAKVAININLHCKVIFMSFSPYYHTALYTKLDIYCYPDLFAKRCSVCYSQSQPDLIFIAKCKPYYYPALYIKFFSFFICILLQHLFPVHLCKVIYTRLYYHPAVIW